MAIAERVAFAESLEGRELLKDAQEAIRTMRRTPSFASGVNRVFQREAPRPKRVWPSILSAVAHDYSVRWNLTISARLVKRCLDEKRLLEKRLEADET